ncbi:MAG TPA: DUF5985 family protein [Burkholderiales bacterium]|nr:DUF5985 family protein [Burkholderiales bacterium]
MVTLQLALFLLAILTSGACMVLLYRAYVRSGAPLLFWSALCFVFLTLNNVLVFADVIILPEIDLRLYRSAAALAGIACLLYAFIWETE